MMHLDLSWNGIDNESAESISEALTENSSLQVSIYYL